jgi:hypothetical protein
VKLYRILDWEKIYENNRSRTVKDLAWVAIPNRHDGEGYSMIMAHPKAAEIFAAWILMLQVASRCQPRGSLVRDNGRPHTPQSLALKTRAKAEWFVTALQVLSSDEIGWIECEEMPENIGDAPHCHPPVSVPTAACQSGDEEQNGMEWNGTGLNTPQSPPPPCSTAPSLGRPADEGGRGRLPDSAVDPPAGFPKTVDEAKAHAACVGCPENFVEKTWTKASGRGGRDSKDIPIRNWRAHLATEWKYERERLANKREHAARQQIRRPSIDRSAGTANEGKAGDYAGLG